ncbi:hypothetical protein AVEN_258209-1 [Araneus ventricosus]|uniref:Uncharacterized protein n=1 Tax=Araneus ventricosus TaxID=182803 RepID=A0A4Y2NNC6_ARAVE|nr:hypothetical protein AVEN_258209-1 [Araneus ventricosus]
MKSKLRFKLLLTSYLKSEIRSAALSIWRDNWDNGETSRSTHDIMPRVSNKPVGWNREEIMFVAGHGTFPSYLHRFNILTQENCSCGGKGDLMHYATKCWLNYACYFSYHRPILHRIVTYPRTIEEFKTKELAS